MEFGSARCKVMQRISFMTVLWNIRKERNMRYLKGKAVCVEVFVEILKLMVASCSLVCQFCPCFQVAQWIDSGGIGGNQPLLCNSGWWADSCSLFVLLFWAGCAVFCMTFLPSSCLFVCLFSMLFGAVCVELIAFDIFNGRHVCLYLNKDPNEPLITNNALSQS